MAAVLNAERLEVSVDGLTLSPDPEERPGAEGAPLLPPPLPPPSPPGSGRGPGAAGEQPEPGEAVAGGAAEEARRLEQRWGFGLEELYGLALRFFKGELDRPHPRRLCGALERLDPSSPDLPFAGPRRPELGSVLGSNRSLSLSAWSLGHTPRGLEPWFSFPGPASRRLAGILPGFSFSVFQDPGWKNEFSFPEGLYLGFFF